jgi:hypothetical protein
VAQQKCLAHLIRNAAKVGEDKTGRARQFGQQLKDILRRALLLSANRKEMTPKHYDRQAAALDDELTTHLRDRILRDPDNQQLLNGVLLMLHHDRGHVLRFLGEAETGSAAGRRGAQGFALPEKRAGSKGIRGLHQRPTYHS